jgi:RNA polymerase sigma-70 factor, ECF subfamily
MQTAYALSGRPLRAAEVERVSLRDRLIPRRDAAPDDLERAFRRREDGSLEEAYRRHAPAVLGFLVSVTGDRGAAEDVLQEVFVDAWRRAGDFDPRRAGLATWLMVIARSRAVDHLRRRIPEPRDHTDPAVVTATDPVDAVDDMLGRWRFAALLATLSEEDAHLLRLRFHEGLSQSEISERTGMPLGTVKTRMNRALERLRALVETEEGRR